MEIEYFPTSLFTGARPKEKRDARQPTIWWLLK
jgi:hypothetical protein